MVPWLLCALLGGERWGAIAGIVCGTAVSLALFPKVQLLGIYALAGMAAGVFSSGSMTSSTAAHRIAYIF